MFGSRLLLSDSVSHALLSRVPSYEKVCSLFSGRKFLKPLGLLRRIPVRSWKTARGFIFCISQSDLLRLGGFDENFESWGLEDSDFFVRALRSGRLVLVDSRYKTSVLHLFIPNDKTIESDNSSQFQLLLQSEGRKWPNKTSLLAGEHE